MIAELLNLLVLDAGLCVGRDQLCVLADFLEEHGDGRHAAVRELAVRWQNCPAGCLASALPETLDFMIKVNVKRMREQYARPVAVYRQVVAAIGKPSRLRYDHSGPLFWVHEWRLGVKKSTAWFDRVRKLRALPGVTYSPWYARPRDGGKQFGLLCFHSPANMEQLCS